MTCTDEELLVWAEEHANAEPAAGGAARAPDAADATPPDQEMATAPPAADEWREWAVALRLMGGDGTGWRVLTTVGGDGAPYPVQSFLLLDDLTGLGAALPMLLSAARARWRDQPSLPAARRGEATPAPRQPKAATTPQARPTAETLAAALQANTAPAATPAPVPVAPAPAPPEESPATPEPRGQLKLLFT
ncbi:MAG TPA: hypothetical protein VFW96_04120 [Thermomicrobiales bacterium]|nr:hypothetical protein [Thermomicrobiales bacterium]